MRVAACVPCRRMGTSTFWDTVSQGNSVGSWKTKASLSTAFDGSIPSTTMLPAETGFRPEMSLRIVDFPHPLGPISVTKSPRSAEKLMLSSTRGPSP